MDCFEEALLRRWACGGRVRVRWWWVLLLRFLDGFRRGGFRRGCRFSLRRTRRHNGGGWLLRCRIGGLGGGRGSGGGGGRGRAGGDGSGWFRGLDSAHSRGGCINDAANRQTGGLEHEYIVVRQGLADARFGVRHIVYLLLRVARLRYVSGPRGVLGVALDGLRFFGGRGGVELYLLHLDFSCYGLWGQVLTDVVLDFAPGELFLVPELLHHCRAVDAQERHRTVELIPVVCQKLNLEITRPNERVLNEERLDLPRVSGLKSTKVFPPHCLNRVSVRNRDTEGTEHGGEELKVRQNNRVNEDILAELHNEVFVLLPALIAHVAVFILDEDRGGPLAPGVRLVYCGRAVERRIVEALSARLSSVLATQT